MCYVDVEVDSMESSNSDDERERARRGVVVVAKTSKRRAGLMRPKSSDIPVKIKV